MTPILECIELLETGGFIAHFGYLNPSSAEIRIRIGVDNGFSPGPLDRGQPEIFAPGRSTAYPQAALSIPLSDGPLTWSLDGQQITADPDLLSSRCEPSNGPSR